MLGLSANRVVLLLHGAVTVLTGAAIFVAAITHSLPVKWQATAGVCGLMLGGLLAGTTAVVKYLDGSQKYDALQAGAPVAAEAPTLAASEPAPEPDVPDADLDTGPTAADLEAPGTPADQVESAGAPDPETVSA